MIFPKSLASCFRHIIYKYEGMYHMAPDSTKRFVNLDIVQKNDIVMVDLAQPLTETIFLQEYNRVAQIISDLLQKNQKYAVKISNDRKEHTEHSRIRFQTAIPFIGERGTGKTSMMYSVWHRLKNYGDAPNAPFYLGTDNKNVKFIAFDIIDTSSLKSKEDVLEIVLSEMYSYLKNLEIASDDPYVSASDQLLPPQNRMDISRGMYDIFRELYRMIDSLHKDLGVVYWDQASDDVEPGLDSLKRIASSQQTINNFKHVVFRFLYLVSLLKNSGHPCYLVLALDDIDMYQGSRRGVENDQFVLLQQIYDYMRIPGLIVLMTYNENILKRNCLRHFYKTYFGAKPTDQYLNAELEEVETLTRQFLTKLLPPEQRIYLPDFTYIDSANQPNLYIKPLINTDSTSEGDLIPPFTETEKETGLTVKAFMLRLIAYKTGVYFDIAGSKKHFFEPRNLRELGTLFSVIKQMEDMPKNNTEWNDAQSQNRRMLLKYFYHQYSTERLNAEECRQFRKLSMLPLVRQDRTLVDDIRQHRMLVASATDDFGYLSQTTRDRWKYSYGEVLHNLYFATRISLSKKESELFYRSKFFIHCILGTHSTLMNETLQLPDRQSDILEILGSSVAGRWANDMLPTFSLQADADYQADLGSVSLPVRSFFNWKIPDNLRKHLIALNAPSVPKESRQEVAQFVEALILIGMFFTGPQKSSLGITVMTENMINARKQRADEPSEVTLAPENDNSMWYLTSSTVDHICFNAFNFVINLYTAAKDPASLQTSAYFDYIYKKLITLEEHLVSLIQATHPSEPGLSVEDFTNNWNNTLDTVLQKFRTEVTEWEQTYQKFAFSLPVQHFDVMYNIIKRLANDSYHDIPEEAPVGEVYKYFCILYNNIREELDAQDTIYFPQKNGFSAAYTSCLFYKVFTAADGSAYYNEFLKPFFDEMMRNVLPAQFFRMRDTNIPSGIWLNRVLSTQG